MNGLIKKVNHIVNCTARLKPRGSCRELHSITTKMLG